jgi:hypothetical protein
MNHLQPFTFIITGVALLLAIFLYQFLWRRAFFKQAFKRFSFKIIIIAFLLNFAWEMLQMPLYKGMGLNITSVAFCGMASVVDSVMALLLYYLFALLYREMFWILKYSLQRIVVLVLYGALGAIIVEIIHIYKGNWTYSRLMPVIPFVKVGISPVLQFMILPVLTYYMSFYFLSKQNKNKINFLKS